MEVLQVLKDIVSSLSSKVKFQVYVWIEIIELKIVVMNFNIEIILWAKF